MTHPIVTELIEKISLSRHKKDQSKSLEDIKAGLVKEIDCSVYSVRYPNANLDHSNKLTLSEALSLVDKLAKIAQDKNEPVDIIHMPSQSGGVRIMLQSYDFYKSQGMLGSYIGKRIEEGPIEIEQFVP